MSCKKIRKLIDEAERPDLLMPEAARHVESCPACAEFARQRAALRQLLASSGRVGAPPDFQLRLKRRLEELTPPAPALSPLWKLAAAAAAAMLVIGSALLLRSPQQPPNRPAMTASSIARPEPAQIQTPQKIADKKPAAISKAARRRARPSAPRTEELDAMPRAALVLVRGQDVEYELAIPAISIGAQPIFYGAPSSGSARMVKTSF